jgi:adenylate cyclase
MKLTITLLLAFFMINANAINSISPDDFEKTIKEMPESKEKVDMINDYVDKLLKPEPTIDNCKKAKDFALQAAKIAEKLNYKTGMARSYEQLTIIFKTLDFQIQYLKYKSKAALVDRGEEMKKQKDVIEKQNEDLEKQKSDLEKQNQSIAKQKADIEKQKADAARIKRELEVLAKDNTSNKDLILKKQQELAQKETALVQTTGQLDVMKEKAEILANQNKMLEQDKKIKELEVGKKEMEIKSQRLRLYFLLSFVIVLLVMAGVLFNLYKTKQKTAKELSEKNEIIIAEKRRSDELLLNILPAETANELKLTGKAIARDYEMVTVLFTDFKDFTVISESLSPKDLVDEIDMCYCAFDNIIEKHGIEKIKTIGDAYLCAYGIANDIPENNVHDPTRVIDAAFEIAQFMKDMHEKRNAEGKPFFRIRIGIHSGPLVAGVVGRTKFAYDIWGDTVNTAARMEQNSEPGKINISSMTHTMIKDLYNFTHRGKIEAKNKGQIDMYFVDSKKKSKADMKEVEPSSSMAQG